MKYANKAVLTAKKVLVCRLSYIVNQRLRYTTGRALANQLKMSPNIVSKLKNEVHEGISFDAILEAAERLQVRFELVIKHNGRGKREVNVQMEDITASRVRSLGDIDTSKINKVQPYPNH